MPEETIFCVLSLNRTRLSMTKLSYDYFNTTWKIFWKFFEACKLWKTYLLHKNRGETHLRCSYFFHPPHSRNKSSRQTLNSKGPRTESYCICLYFSYPAYYLRGGSRTAAISKVEHFVIIVNGWKSLTVITKAPSWMLQQS